MPGIDVRGRGRSIRWPGDSGSRGLWQVPNDRLQMRASTPILECRMVTGGFMRERGGGKKVQVRNNRERRHEGIKARRHEVVERQGTREKVNWFHSIP